MAKDTDLTNKRICVIGAGLSGLVAAQVFEKHGYSPVILEATDRVGGRVKTDIVSGYQLDRGFQVLLSSYPAAKKYLDYETLNLQKLYAGAYIFNKRKRIKLGDPSRHINLLMPTLFSDIGSLADKIKILLLNRSLTNKSLHEIFSSNETSTLDYLKKKGFSSKIISRFFRPFFAGIFLEPRLITSSRMFEFVFKMFSDGFAMIPKGGMEEIPKQLLTKLQKTTVKYTSKVNEINSDNVLLSTGEKINFDAVVVAVEPGKLLSTIIHDDYQWKSCDTLYFTIPKRHYRKPFIGLISDDGTLVNNIFYHSSIGMRIKGDDDLLSVTVVKTHKLSDLELIDSVKKELKQNCGIEGVSFLRKYHIKKALPLLKKIKYNTYNAGLKLSQNIFLAGDYRLNSSLNGAMISGENAALAAIAYLKNK